MTDNIITLLDKVSFKVWENQSKIDNNDYKDIMHNLTLIHDCVNKIKENE